MSDYADPPPETTHGAPFEPEGEADFSERVIPPEQMPWWEWLRRKVWPTRAEYEAGIVERLADLEDAILHEPDAPANYVLRGELYLELGWTEEAIVDFECAQGVAERALNNRDWGIIAQVMRDRARYGVQQAQKQMRRKRRVVFESAVNVKDDWAEDVSITR